MIPQSTERSGKFKSISKNPQTHLSGDEVYSLAFSSPSIETMDEDQEATLDESRTQKSHIQNCQLQVSALTHSVKNITPSHQFSHPTYHVNCRLDCLQPFRNRNCICHWSSLELPNSEKILWHPFFRYIKGSVKSLTYENYDNPLVRLLPMTRYKIFKTSSCTLACFLSQQANSSVFFLHSNVSSSSIC